MKKFNKKIFTAACAGAVLAGMSVNANAANWLMLQGTEPSGEAPRVKVWGFVQAQYQKDESDPCTNPNCGPALDGYIPPKLVGPNLDSQEGFNVNRVGIGFRGTGFPLDSKVNYFVLAQLGNNGVTYGSDNQYLTDASITLNHLKGARIRAGLFKTPGFEEGLQAVAVADYVNLTTVGNQLMLERFPQDGDVFHIPTATPNADMNAYQRSVGAFRDVGLQIFDTFKTGGWETSYALMYGNGNGLNFGDNDENKDVYAYLSTEMVMGGKGPRREGLKIFAWYQDGKRTNPWDRTLEQDRTRQGGGVKYLKKPFRATAEYMSGKGMIFQGQHRPGPNPPNTVPNFNGQWNDEKAEGYYVDFGWYIGNTKWEIDLRYDSYTRGENHQNSAPDDESRYDTITAGVQYHFNKKTRLNVEYADRDFESDTQAVNYQLEGVKGRMAVQLTHIF